MKIGVDIRVLMDKKYSGVSEYTANLLKAILKESESDNQFVFYYNSGKNISKRMNEWKRDNVEIVASSYPNKFFNYFLQKIFSYPKIENIIGEVDIFWSPHFNFSSFSEKYKTKRVLTVHDLSFIRYPKYFNWRQNLWHRLLNVKKIISNSDRVVAVSENTKNDIVDLIKKDKEDVEVIYSGNNLLKKEIKKVEVEKFRNKYFANSNFPYILYLGTIEPRKNISNLIKAYNLFRERNENTNIKLVLAGMFGWKTKKIFKEYKKSKYREDIIFLNYVEKEDKDVLYSQAKLFVYPSFYEGFGFPPLEAMTYGIPTICSNVSSLPEIVSGSALMINPFNVEEIAIAIENVLKDKDYYNYLSEKSLKRAQDFSWDISAKKYLQLFKDLKNEERK